MERTPQAASASAVLPNALLVNSGELPIRARIIDKDGGLTDFVETLSIGNSSAMITNLVASSLQIDSTNPITISGTFAGDAGINDTHSIQIDWGDGHVDRLSATRLLAIQAAGSGYVDAIGVPVTGGSGTGMTLNIAVDNGQIIEATINSPGSGYQVGDVLNVTGGGNDAIVSLGAFSQAAGSFAASHAYAVGTQFLSNPVTVKVTVSDQEGGQDVQQVDLAVVGGIELDFGDALDSIAAPLYPTLLENDGARHVIGSLFLGSRVDADPDGLPTSNADGDDSTGQDDEDGVAFVASLVSVDASTTKSSVSVVASEAGKLDAWIDFNQDGDWNDVGEQIFTSATVSAGTNLLSFDVIAGATPGETAARFRLSRSGGLLPTGAADDGEVEDYVVTILDGDAPGGVDVQIRPATAGVIDVSTEGADLVVRSGAVEMFRVPDASLHLIDIVGTDGDDTINVADVDAVFSDAFTSDAGGGNDQLRLTGADQDLDLTLLADDAIRSIETIDIRGTGDNRIVLRAAEIIALANAGNEVTILMDSNDVLDTSGDDFKITATEIVDNVLQIVATGGGVTLKIRGANWTNPLDRYDVNKSGNVTPLDALVILNQLVRRDLMVGTTSRLVDPTTLDPPPSNFYDVTGEGILTPWTHYAS
ncbi:MAG: GEVED domain-containing protein [Pirellulaceae bacterium]